jgi:putative transcriptional regulator
VRTFYNQLALFARACLGTSTPALLFLISILCPVDAALGAENFTGQLLVAAPEMSDPRFFQAVIYMVRNDENGAMGLVINKPIARGPIADLLKSFGRETEESKGDITLHYGGPVESSKGFILHSDDFRLDSTVRVRDGIALTGDVEVLRALSAGKGPRRSLLVLGYAGWAPGQLEAEIKTGAWFLIPAEEEFIFGSESESKWDRALDKRKIKL